MKKKNSGKVVLYVNQQTKDFEVRNLDEFQNQQVSKKQKKQKKVSGENITDQIWDEFDEIDLDYASVGFSSTNRIIYSYELMFELLMSRGYSYEAVRLFMDEFAGSLKDSKEYPILMNSIGRLNILANQ